MKRQMDDIEEDHNDGAGDGPSIKKRRGEGPHVECRVLLASKVRSLLRSSQIDGKRNSTDALSLGLFNRLPVKLRESNVI